MTCFRQRLDLRHLMLTIGVLLPLALLQPPSPAHADEHTDWQLYLGAMPGPLAGHCGGELHARGVSFPSDVTVVLGRITESGAFHEFQRVAAQDGWFSEVLTAPYPPDCAPGNTVAISARVLDSTGTTFLGSPGPALEVLRQFQTRVDHTSLSLDPAVGPSCRETMTMVSGEGFLPNIDVDLRWGGADPFAHNFASLGVISADTNGRFEQEVNLLFGRCGFAVGTRVAISASSVPPDGEAPEGGTRYASAIYTVGTPTPTPAPTGNAGLLRQASQSRSIQLLLLAATVALVTVGYTTSRGPHQ